MDLVNIPRFLAVMEAESFAGAAKRYRKTPQTIALMENYTDILIKRLMAGEIDLIAGAPVTALRESENLVQEMLFEAFDFIVARREHPLARRLKVRLEDMQRFTWLVPYARSDTRDAIIRAYVQKGLTPPTSFIFSDTATVGFALMRTEDYLLLSPPDLVTLGGESHLVRIRSTVPTLKRTACLIHRADQPLSESANLLRDRILTMAHGSGGWRKKSAPLQLARSGAARKS